MADAGSRVAFWWQLGRVAEWQTRWLQVPVFERTWGFKSPLAHQMVTRQLNRTSDDVISVEAYSGEVVSG